MVLLGAPINFILLQRLPLGHELRNRQSRRSILLLDLALLVAFGVPCSLFGVLPVLRVYLPVIIIASWVGNWLFFVQHQFEEAHWERDGNWNFHIAAVAGSSYFELPRSCSGSPGTSGCTTCTTCAAGFPITGSKTVSMPLRNCKKSPSL